MLRPEVEYWSTPAAYVEQLDRARRPTWREVLSGVFAGVASAIRRHRADRLRRPQRIQGTIPAHIRQDIGLPPAGDFPWYRDPGHGGRTPAPDAAAGADVALPGRPLLVTGEGRPLTCPGVSPGHPLRRAG